MKLSKLLVCALLLFSLQSTSADAFLPQVKGIKFLTISGKCVITNVVSGAVLGIVTGPVGLYFNTATCTAIGYWQYSGPQETIAIVNDMLVDTIVSVASGGTLNTKNMRMLENVRKTCFTYITKNIGNNVAAKTAQSIGAKGLKYLGIGISNVQKTYSTPIINAVADSFFSNNAKRLVKNVKLV
ncbi:14996_t:CDS:1 [Funneliformis caledonium]|uniref:14996_t:CDS:1 n=1 Tax=Funneliformis caledonium TaxID=1117310 RepID=A0A9N9EHT9_9GLOM|nr:14996_t:CDS:1 [Funneliformis caledonium]